MESKAEICPIIFMLDLLSAKWTVQILRELSIQPVRTRQFLTLLPGISMKTLIERLKLLESYGVITRTVYPDLPLRVEYSLAPRGRQLYDVLVNLKTVGSQFLGSSCTCPFEFEHVDLDDVMCPERKSAQISKLKTH